MQKIGDITNTADKNGEFTNGNVAAGIAPTLLDAGWFNTVQRELINAIQGAGIKLDNKNDSQLFAAIKKQIDNSAVEIHDASLTQKGITQLTDKTGSSNTLAATQKLVTDVNNNANTKLAKNQNGADIPDKNAFVKNLGLVETVDKANNALPRFSALSAKVGGLILNDMSDWPHIEFEATSKYLIGIEGTHASRLTIYAKDAAGNRRYTLATPEKSGTLATTDDINTPVGVPLPYPHRYTPGGYLTCNGQTFDKSLYPKLAEAYPSGRVPDLRGEFIRGWDDSRGVDPGRVCGTWQPQQVQWHQHLGGRGGRAQGAFGVTNQAGHPGSYHDDGQQTLPFTNNGSDYQGFSNNGVVGNETRPRNVAFNYIVRAA